jgi:hypothetical protein
MELGQSLVGAGAGAGEGWPELGPTGKVAARAWAMGHGRCFVCLLSLVLCRLPWASELRGFWASWGGYPHASRPLLSQAKARGTTELGNAPDGQIRRRLTVARQSVEQSAELGSGGVHLADPPW